MRQTARAVWLLAFIYLIHTGLADAQQAKKIPRIGFVSVSNDPKNPGRNIEAFRQGIRDLGYEEGKNVLTEYRYTTTQPDRVPELVG